jgi:uncharacterized membrane protein
VLIYKKMEKVLLTLAAAYFSTNSFFVKYTDIEPVACFSVFAIVTSLCCVLMQLTRRVRPWERVGDAPRERVAFVDLILLPLFFLISKLTAFMAFQMGAISTLVPIYFAWVPLSFLIDWAVRRAKNTDEEGARLSDWLGHASVAAGILVLSRSDKVSSSHSLHSTILIMVAALFTALRLVYLKHFVSGRIDQPEDTVLLQIWIGGLASALLLLTSQPEISTGSLQLWVPYSVGTFITYIAFYKAFNKLEIGGSTATAVIELPCAAFLGFLAGEWQTSFPKQKIIGILFIMFGFLHSVL